jgi:drug/metabolite transporter (DMT)-like permease
MFGGAVITCYGEVDVSIFGLICFIGGVFVEQLRLVLLKRLVSGNEFVWDPLSTVAVISPIALIVIVVPALAIEGPYLPYSRLSSDSELQRALLINGLIAVSLNVSYVRLLDVISPVTFTVCGVGKDIVTAILSLFLVGGNMTPLQIFGYVMSLVGFAYYDYVKTKQNGDLAASVKGAGKSEEHASEMDEEDQQKDELR